MKKQEEFCSNCGDQVFAKEGQDVGSLWDTVLHCDTCDKDIKLVNTFTLNIESFDNGEVRLKYLMFPINYQKEG